jgi:hypothetical protein
MNKCVFGLAKDDARRLADTLAQRNYVLNLFSKANEEMGKNGLNVFFSSIGSSQEEHLKVYSMLELHALRRKQ